MTDQSSEIAANPDFYRGKPKLDKIVYRIVKQADAAQIALERGEVDYTSAPPNVIRDPEVLNHLLGVPNLFLHRMNNPVSNTLGFNLRLDQWKDKRVRQARRPHPSTSPRVGRAGKGKPACCRREGGAPGA